MVLAGLLIVVSLLHWYVMPQFIGIYEGFKPMPAWGSWGRRTYFAKPELPLVTQILLDFGEAVPFAVASALALCLLLIVGWPILRRTSAGRWLIDRLVLWMPLFGPPLRWNYVARWCDAARVGVEAGLDLPESIRLADDVVASPALRRDGAAMLAVLNSGQPLAASAAPVPRMLPATVPAAIELASQKSDLPNVLATLSELYQRQAEIRLSIIPSILTPLLMLLIAGLIGLVIAGLMLPLLRLFSVIGGGSL